MKLLTFLGTGKYEETVYRWGEWEWKTSFAPVASCHFLQAESLIVFLTEEVQAQYFEKLKGELSLAVQVEPVPVPLGATEAELWQIFAQVSQVAGASSEVAFDITHGLRSFPLIGLLAAVFLKSGFQVNLRAVLYGAYDVGRAQHLPYTPMFDLTPLLALLEWSVAADRFNRTGDARYLASLAKQAQRELALQAQKDRGLLEEAGGLGRLADTLKEISLALQLIRPYQAMQKVAELPRRVEEARHALQRVAAVQPFNALLESVQAAYAPLAHANPQDPAGGWETLRVEREMIGWYIDRELWVQAVSLAREWLISWVMLQIGRPELTQSGARRIAEQILGSESDAFVAAQKKDQAYQPVFLANVPQIESVLGFWPNLAQVRNDIDHAAKRENPQAPQKLAEQIEHLYAKIRALPLSPGVEA